MIAMAEALPPFQAFLDEHLHPVRAFLRGMVGPNDAEDCLQETFLAALRAYPRAEATNLRSWIFTIARRKAIDHHRTRTRRAQPVAEPEELIDRQAASGGSANSARHAPSERLTATSQTASQPPSLLVSLNQ